MTMILVFGLVVIKTRGQTVVVVKQATKYVLLMI